MGQTHTCGYGSGYGYGVYRCGCGVWNFTHGVTPADPYIQTLWSAGTWHLSSNEEVHHYVAGPTEQLDKHIRDHWMHEDTGDKKHTQWLGQLMKANSKNSQSFNHKETVQYLKWVWVYQPHYNIDPIFSIPFCLKNLHVTSGKWDIASLKLIMWTSYTDICDYCGIWTLYLTRHLHQHMSWHVWKWPPGEVLSRSVDAGQDRDWGMVGKWSNTILECVTFRSIPRTPIFSWNLKLDFRHRYYISLSFRITYLPCSFTSSTYFG